MSILANCSRRIIPNIFSPLNVTKNIVLSNCSRQHADKCGGDCRRAIVDIPPEQDPVCKKPCDRWEPRKDNILHKIKLKIVQGGTNFGTPFRRVLCNVPKPKQKKKRPRSPEKPKKAKAPEKKLVPVKLPDPRPGTQVTILGVDTAVGQYLALLLKQCPTIKTLRLYEAKDHDITDNRNICNVAQDLQHINTSCTVQAYSCSCCDLERCLQSSDVVVILENGEVKMDMSLEDRFNYQAPIIKTYADAIATECPQAFIIVCASPIDCMVPLIAQTMKETGWYDPRKLFGSMAVPEMRASTLAARALSLEPRYTRVPCVGGTESESLVPLFSKALEYFDFAEKNAVQLTEAVRQAPCVISKTEGSGAAYLSEAHALAKLVLKVSHAQLCIDVPRVTGFVETDASQVISPARFIANLVQLDRCGVVKNLGLPKLTDQEKNLVDVALIQLHDRLTLAEDWYCKYLCSSSRYLAIEVMLEREGIAQKFDFPCKMNDLEVELMAAGFGHLQYNVELANQWYSAQLKAEIERCEMSCKKDWFLRTHYNHLDECTVHLT